jgi:hypothetical protein
MISVRVEYGNADRVGDTVTDDLITTEDMARVRGIQELYAHTKIIRSRTVGVPHDPTLKSGSVREFALSQLGINGRHKVISNTITISTESITNMVVLEEYSDMPQLTGA